MSAQPNYYDPNEAVWIEPEPVRPGTRRMRRWRQRNRQRALVQSAVAKHRTKARRDGLPCTLTSIEWLAYLEATGWHCLACGLESDRLTIGHIIPHSKGGPLTLENVQPLCMPCNRRQGKKVIDYRSNYAFSS